MSKVKNLQDLKKMRDELKGKISLREKSDHPESMVQIKVSMATCGIASGARETMNYMIDELDSQAVDAVVTQTGCMGYCYAEPTIEVTLPGEKPVVFGHVNTKKASEIIEKYIKNGELVDGIIPDSYETIDDK
ncbi:ferredoxin [Marinilabilia salmonicolor]|jgi:NADP-reducing hydrogenase subunit HndB|uniref:NAD(P)-dependent iron-only hydrogenase iron-sulfur protein n=1 Tax=Marinilabilia salmonicolor TaxID=989 RepID=A0A2T0XB48_9BACT|nr:(2Fe-2S) ferredoxin domain-containing protein [Marinilabilia salmonicolor]PRY96155.1 NAD(P)-dependent iron-only hydrogenase iron-sulfur protein [Marinilabilia salmonicolor]RCW35251.1 NAD(P)-dependent iron-only hydrogenase iron-sulfur protein [Marinilabilia salmonicolor]